MASSRCVIVFPLRVKLADAHQHVEAVEFQAFLEADHRRMVGGEKFVFPLHRADNHVDAQRHGFGEEGAFQRAFDRRAVGALGRKHDREIAQADRGVAAGQLGARSTAARSAYLRGAHPVKVSSDGDVAVYFTSRKGREECEAVMHFL